MLGSKQQHPFSFGYCSAAGVARQLIGGLILVCIGGQFHDL